MGKTYWGVRPRTFEYPTSAAMTWIPVAPTTATPTRVPTNSTRSQGYRAVSRIGPLKPSRPGNGSLSGAESIQQQVIRNRMSMLSPRLVATVQQAASLF
ncbi:hypothetical protein JL100_032330 (plasmid) [Skermanella mucosa]|uniref:hypothetical protein n=1 Tax=Skermanella mucosa TaxID=1789672 RepID=UPI001E54150B|nr:hypothetical protein [Skermanella mucosa]UEM24767.1 hypothetical protein JL100_032330 [Skermanella mucosa]